MSLAAIKINISKRMTTPEGERMLDIDSEIMGGRLTCLVGELGTGKSTLLRMLAGLTQPDEGRISADGEIWFDAQLGVNLSPQARDIGYLFQDLDLFPDMNIDTALAGVDAAVAGALKGIFGLEDLVWSSAINQRACHKQRVTLARAFAARPRLLLLDEPLSSGDVCIRDSLQNAILKAQQHLGVTTVMVTRSMREALQMSDTLIRIKNRSATHSHESHCACTQ